MATGTLTATTIAARYKSLLKITGTANDTLHATTLKLIEDGDGNDSPLYLAQQKVKILSATDSTTMFQILDADGGTPIFNVDSTNERIGIGTASPTGQLEIANTGTDCVVRITTYDDDPTDVSQLILQTADNTEDSPQLIDNNDLLGVIKFRGYTNAFNDGAWIQARAAATPASGSDMPADLEFATSADGSASPSTRMVILSDGKVGIGTATPAAILQFGQRQFYNL